LNRVADPGIEVHNKQLVAERKTSPNGWRVFCCSRFTMNHKSLSLSLLLGITPVTFAASSTLDFSGLGLPNYGDIPTTYGDNLANTPNVLVDYRTVSVADNATTLANNLDYWDNNYGDLVGVAFPVSSGWLGEISLVPDAGYGVILDSFDLGGYSQADKPLQTVRILDANWNVLVDFSPYNVEGNSGHSTFNPSLSHFGTLRIQYGPDWNTGIDNITFRQFVRGIPTPDGGSSLALSAIGFASLIVMRRLRR
jgi:hypothetical protein